MASDPISAQTSAAVLAVPQAVSSPLTTAAIFLVVTINPGNENRTPVLPLCADLSALPRSVGIRALKGCLSYGDLVRNLTHKELAQHLRVYRESATAALGDLKKAGIIEIGRKQIRILDHARLKRAARE